MVCCQSFYLLLYKMELTAKEVEPKAARVKVHVSILCHDYIIESTVMAAQNDLTDLDWCESKSTK
jgi:hypothetical protein